MSRHQWPIQPPRSYNRLQKITFNGGPLTDVSKIDTTFTHRNIVNDVTNHTLTDVQKFSYLQSLLKADDMNVINGLTLSSANYHNRITHTLLWTKAQNGKCLYERATRITCTSGYYQVYSTSLTNLKPIYAV